MKTTVFAIALILGIIAPVSYSFAADSLVRFEGGIGVISVSSVAPPQNDNGTFQNVNRNDMRGVPPGGQPWVIKSLRAEVEVDGTIRVRGEGLLLAGGNNVGTNGNASVFATLFCGEMQHSSNLSGVPLSKGGDFMIDDVLIPVPPAMCENPALLIRTTNGGRWFAAGIPND